MGALRRSLLLLPVLWTLQGCGSEGNPEEDGETVETTGDADAADHVEGLEADIPEADRDAETEPIRDTIEEEEIEVPAYILYIGELHGHTELSDGTGTPTEYFAYCRDVSMLDFCALTDHNLEQSYLDMVIAAANSFNSPTFVAFPGAEWSRGDIGHKPCYAMVTSCPGWSDSCDTPAELYASVEGDGGLCHAAHPASASLGTNWGMSDDVVEVAGEIYQDEAKMNDAWRMGLKLGAVGVSDTHDGVPGSSGVTGCYATGLTRGEILEALAARRCFATNSRSNVAHFPMEMTFKIDGRWMGQSITVPSGSTLAFEVTVDAMNDVDHIYLKTDETTVEAQNDCNDTTCAWSGTVTVDGPVYFYVVATAVEGEKLWSSPLWIDVSG